MEAYLRAGKNNGGIPETPKTRSLILDHQERKHRQLQGTKGSLRDRHKPHPERSRVRHQEQPKAQSQCHGGRHVTKTCYREERWRELRTTEDSRQQLGPPGNHPGTTGHKEEPQSEALSTTRRRKCRAPTKIAGRAEAGTNQHTDPYSDQNPKGSDNKKKQPQKGKGNTRTSFRSRTNLPRPHRGDPITQGVNHMGEENPQESGKPEQAGERTTGKKARKPYSPTKCGRTTTGTASQHTQGT